MKINKLYLSLLLVIFAVAASSCSDKESYSDLLNSERDAVNAYLSTQRVVNNIPADTVFETGPDAPFYRIDPDGNVYMQVIRYTKHSADSAKTSQNIYFRYTRYNLLYLYNEGDECEDVTGGWTIDDMSQEPAYFQYNNYSMPQSSEWGYGVQMPLWYLGVDSEVNIVVKSQYGKSSEISYVVPFMYHIRYFRSRI